MAESPLRFTTALFIVALACGDVVVSEPDANKIDATPISACADGIEVEELPGCYKEFLCRFYTECTGFFESAAECDANVFGFLHSFGAKPEHIIDRYVAQINAGKIELNSQAASQCFKTVDPCNAASVICDQMITGLMGDGEECVSNDECGASGVCLIAQPQLQCKPGMCSAPVGLGVACDDVDRCERGLVCITDQVTQTASCASGDLGQPCNQDVECDRELYCDEQAGTCKAKLAEGGVCALTADCTTPLACIAGRCNRPDADGDPCEGTCYGPYFCQSGEACRPLPVLGESCEASLRCLGASVFCDTDRVCKSRLPLDAPCTVGAIDAQCAYGTICDAGTNTCRPPRADGSSCTGNLDCGSVLCEQQGETPGNNVCKPLDVCY